jgi:hypothetical protein
MGGGTFIFGMMLALIVGSIVLELILPMRVKQRLGVVICWGMMAFTMTFLVASTVGLAGILGTLIYRSLTG